MRHPLEKIAAKTGGAAFAAALKKAAHLQLVGAASPGRSAGLAQRPERSTSASLASERNQRYQRTTHPSLCRHPVFSVSPNSQSPFRQSRLSVRVLAPVQSPKGRNLIYSSSCQRAEGVRHESEIVWSRGRPPLGSALPEILESTAEF